jgi:transposase
MKVARMVRRVWNRFREKRRKVIRSIAKQHPDANTRRRAQIVLALVQNKKARDIVEVLQYSSSLVYKVGHGFLENQEGAFADRREDNGETVVTKEVQRLVWVMVAETPRQFGQRRPTWTLELLSLVMKKRTNLRVSRTTLCRLLRRLSLSF